MTLYHTPEDRVIVFVTMITLNLIGISKWYSEEYWASDGSR